MEEDKNLNPFPPEQNDGGGPGPEIPKQSGDGDASPENPVPMVAESGVLVVPTDGTPFVHPHHVAEFESYTKFIAEYKGRPGYHYGLSKIDDETNGFHQRELIVIGGRPGESKTTLATQLAWNLSKAGRKVIYFSNEMPGPALWIKVVSSELKIPQRMILRDELSDGQRDLIKSFIDNTLSKKLFMVYDQKEGVDPMKMMNVLKKEQPDVWFVDHIQMGRTGKQFQKRNEMIEEFVYWMKNAADKMKNTGVAISQCSRSVEGRKNFLPFMSDLKGSGAIEEVADTIFLLAWPWKTVASRDTEGIMNDWERRKAEADKEKYSDPHDFYIEISKNRMGAIGNCKVRYNFECCCFGKRDDEIEKQPRLENSW